MGTFNFKNTNMVSLAYVPAYLSDEEIQARVEECFPEWIEDDDDMPESLRLLTWRERIHDYDWEDGHGVIDDLMAIGRAVRDALERRFPFHREINEYCADWSWEFEVRNGYYDGVQLVLSSQVMDDLFEPVRGGLADGDRQEWDDFYELAVGSQEFSGVTRQDFGAILDKVWRFANYALTRFGMEKGYKGAVGSWTRSTYTLDNYDKGTESEKEKGVFNEWYQGVMRSYEWHCK